MSFNFDTVSLITLLVGLALCFCGFRLKKVGIAIIWFVVGYSLSKLLISNFVSDYLAINGISVAIGIILGVVGYSLEKLGIYIAVGLLTFKFLYNILSYTELVNIVLSVLGGIMVASIAIKFIKPITIIVTAFGGSSILIEGLKGMLHGPSNKTFLLIEVVFIIFGILYQFKSNKGIE